MLPTPDGELTHRLLEGELAPDAAGSTTPTEYWVGSGDLSEASPVEPAGTASRPQSIGGFRIIGPIGGGGMGAVYLAEDINLKRRVALKVMKPEIAVFEESRNRFMLEAQAAARIKHDHVVDIYQVGIDDGWPFIAMPLLEGESLDDRLNREKVSSVPMLLKVGREVAMGLLAAHEKKLIHRDIKPANIWLEGDPNPQRPESKFRRTKILDFGLARCLETGVQTTRNGTILGSPLFMAPEQGTGKPTDARSDLFSLGVVLYRMATGEQPFKGETVMEVLMSLATHQPVAPKVLNPDVPDDLSNAIMRLMQKEPGLRYQSAREVVAEIEGIIRAIKARGKAGTSDTVPISIAPLKLTALPKLIPIPDFDPPAKSRLLLWLGLAAGGLFSLAIILAVTLSSGASKSTSVAPTLSPTAPIVMSPKAPTAGEEKSFEIASGVMMKFCWIPAGEAQLGSPKEEQEHLMTTYIKGERPTWLDDESESSRGKYKSEGFWMAKYPVTQGEWKAVMGNAPSKSTGDRLPVEQVCWYDSLEFCNKASAKLGLTARYKLSEIERNADGTIKTAKVEVEEGGKGPRLPLEDEWEYACRGGSGNKTAFYWGDVLDGDKANCDGNVPYGTETKGAYLRKTSEVGAYEDKAKHPWGLCDLSGNVWQRCESLYSKEGSDRVIRGGCWCYFAGGCRSALRGWMDPAYRDGNVGFRLAVPEPGK